MHLHTRANFFSHVLFACIAHANNVRDMHCADSTNRWWTHHELVKETRYHDTDYSRQERDSNSRNMITKDRESVEGDKTIPSRRKNGTVVPRVSDESSESKFEEKREKQRWNVIALVVIFIGSLLVMALLFYNFPELDEWVPDSLFY